MKKMFLLLIVFSVLLSGCGSESTEQNIDIGPTPYCDSSRPVGQNGCPPDTSICVNNETCVAS